jgi:hypothetical protein
MASSDLFSSVFGPNENDPMLDCCLKGVLGRIIRSARDVELLNSTDINMHIYMFFKQVYSVLLELHGISNGVCLIKQISERGYCDEPVSYTLNGDHVNAIIHIFNKELIHEVLAFQSPYEIDVVATEQKRSTKQLIPRSKGILNIGDDQRRVYKNEGFQIPEQAMKNFIKMYVLADHCIEHLHLFIHTHSLDHQHKSFSKNESFLSHLISATPNKKTNEFVYDRPNSNYMNQLYKYQNVDCMESDTDSSGTDSENSVI